MTRKLLYLLAATAICSAASPALAGSFVNDLTPFLVASPRHYTGHCPGVITFNGSIHVKGTFTSGSSVEIGYQFTRSDGATGQNQFVSVTHAGPQAISETWTLGDKVKLPTYVGWEKVKVWVTDSGQHPPGLVPVYSNEAHFRLVCT